MYKKVSIRNHVITITRKIKGQFVWNEYPKIKGKNRRNIMRIVNGSGYTNTPCFSAEGQKLFDSYEKQ